MYRSSRTLKERGWTDSMINSMEPDLLVTNRHHKSGPKMRLFLNEKTEKIEQTEGFKKKKDHLLQHRAKRQAGAQKALETKATKLCEEMQNIEIQYYGKVTLAKAVEHYNEFHYWRFDGKYIDPGTIEFQTDEFKERIMMNYGRHELTNYDSLLRYLSGKIGYNEAYEILNEKIDYSRLIENFKFVK